MTAKDQLKKLIDELPEAIAGELLDFAEFLRQIQARAGALDDLSGRSTDEDRAWLDADLSRSGELEPYDWGGADPLAGESVTWDAESGAIVVGDAR